MVKWLDDFIKPDSMTRWIIEKSQGFTDAGLLGISKSVRAKLNKIFYEERPLNEVRLK